MFRKPIFLGLTIMLAGALAYLVIQGRRQEKLQRTASRPVEVIRNSPASLTRVLAPDDLDIAESKVEFGPPASKPGQEATGETATHSLVIRNSGLAAYHSLGLRVSYLGRGNKVLGTQTVPVADLIQPGQARSIPELKVDNVPAGTLKCEVKILYGDLEPNPSSSQPQGR